MRRWGEKTRLDCEEEERFITKWREGGFIRGRDQNCTKGESKALPRLYPKPRLETVLFAGGEMKRPLSRGNVLFV